MSDHRISRRSMMFSSSSASPFTKTMLAASSYYTVEEDPLGQQEPFVKMNYKGYDDATFFANLGHILLELWSLFWARIRRHWYKLFYMHQGDSWFNFNLKYLLKVVPGTNFLMDLFFDDSHVQTDSVRSLLDAFGLVNGLMLVTGVDFMVNYDIEEFHQIDDRYYNDAGTGYHTWWTTWIADIDTPPSQYFYKRLGSSLVILFTNIIMVIYIYADMTSKIPEKDVDAKIKRRSRQKMIVLQKRQNNNNAVTQTNNWGRTHVNLLYGITTDGVTKEELRAEEHSLQEVIKVNTRYTQQQVTLMSYREWWSYAKFALVVVTVSSVCGVAYIGLVVLMMFLMKYPDYYMLDNGQTDFLDGDSMRGKFIYTFGLTFCLVAWWIMWLTGFGTASSYIRWGDYHELEWFQKELKAANLPRNLTLKQKLERLRALEEGSVQCNKVRRLLEHYIRFLVDAQLELKVCREYIAVFTSVGKQKRSFRQSRILTTDRIDFLLFRLIGCDGLEVRHSDDRDHAQYHDDNGDGEDEE